MHRDALRSPQQAWTNAVAPDTSFGVAERCALAARLGVIGEPWCVDVLEAALREDRAEEVRDEAWRALLALRTGVISSY